MDVAASHFYRSDDKYDLGGDDSEGLSSAEMIDLVDEWVTKFPIVSVEDALAEDDWDHWPMLRSRLAGRALVLGDDLLCTNPTRIRRAIDEAAADALLLKVNHPKSIHRCCLSVQHPTFSRDYLSHAPNRELNFVPVPAKPAKRHSVSFFFDGVDGVYVY